MWGPAWGVGDKGAHECQNIGERGMVAGKKVGREAGLKKRGQPNPRN